MRKGEGDSQCVEVLHGRSVLLPLLLLKLLHCHATFRPSIWSEDDFEELPTSNVGVEAMPLCDSEVPATDRERESLEEVQFCKDLPRMDEERVDIPNLEDREWLLCARACANEFLGQEDAVVARALFGEDESERIGQPFAPRTAGHRRSRTHGRTCVRLLRLRNPRCSFLTVGVLDGPVEKQHGVVHRPTLGGGTRKVRGRGRHSKSRLALAMTSD